MLLIGVLLKQSHNKQPVNACYINGKDCLVDYVHLVWKETEMNQIAQLKHFFFEGELDANYISYWAAYIKLHNIHYAVHW